MVISCSLSQGQWRTSDCARYGASAHIRRALRTLRIQKRIGWHSFRHGLGTMLRRQGIDLKTAQELLRHANSHITNDLYQQAVSEEKHLANAVVVKALLGDSLLQHPKTPSEGV